MSEVTRKKRRQSSNTTWRKAWILLGIVFVVIAGQQLYTIHTLNQEKEQLQQQLQELKQESDTFVSLFLCQSWLVLDAVS